MAPAASASDVAAALERVRPYVRLTPVLHDESLDGMAARRLLFKAEAMQRGGSFKIRGATNAVLRLPDSVAAKGVVTHSSGNHAIAVALAAKARGINAHIVVPEGAPAVKVAQVRAAGAELTFCEPTMAGREAACAAITERTGATVIPPYNHADVIAGQGTIAAELVEQLADDPLDAVIVPISGGGMTSGIAVFIKDRWPSCAVVAAEPTGDNDAADVAASKKKGELVVLDKPATIADGLQARLGDLTWPIVRDLVDEVVTVSEMEIKSACRSVYEQLKIAVEPSGAVGLAAVLSPQWNANPKLAAAKRVGIILCGGNVDVEQLGAIFAGTTSSHGA